MNVVTRRRLQEFWARHPRAEAPLKAWYRLVRAAEWSTPQDIRDQFGNADFLADNRVIFDVAGNHYRIVVRVSYPFKQVLVKFVGTHKEHNDIDPATV